MPYSVTVLGSIIKYSAVLHAYTCTCTCTWCYCTAVECMFNHNYMYCLSAALISPLIGQCNRAFHIMQK